MKNIIVGLTVLASFFLMAPSSTPADQVSKNSVILKEVSELTSVSGVPVAQELIYAGGISGNRSTQVSSGEVGRVTLRELRALKGTFSFSRGGTMITVKVLPMVATKNHHGVWKPAAGRWDFKTRETNSYKSVIHVKKGGDLDIVYQSTGLSVGNQDTVMHYGLSGNPHAISLSRKRLKTAFASPQSPSNLKPILNYRPADDIILVQMELTPEGLLFKPIFDYRIAK